MHAGLVLNMGDDSTYIITTPSSREGYVPSNYVKRVGLDSEE